MKQVLDPHFAAEGIVPKDETGTEARLSTPHSKHLHLSQVVSCLASCGPHVHRSPKLGGGGEHREWAVEQTIMEYT